MVQAWRRGISTTEFRKCLTSDLSFINDFDEALKIRSEKDAHDVTVKEAMEKLMNKNG